GELYMLGGLVTVIACNLLGVPYLVTLVLAPVIMLVVGVGLDKLAIGPLLDRRDGLSDVVLSTFAVSLLLLDLVLAVVGPAPERVEGLSGVLILGPVIISHQRLFVIVLGFILIAGLDAMLRYSRFGIEMRAAAQDRFAAEAVGIDVNAIGTRTIMLGAAIAGIAGALLVPVTQFTPLMGQNVVIKAFVVVVIGGMGSVPGAVLCGVGLGLIEALVNIRFSEGMTTAIIYSLLLVGLLMRPQGLFGRAAR
ncbi:MAG: branched-chain amino acid ABC transporter permease, partial [Xanthobacteraceae bacterium]|nr:branched-chain amino acid ABC transporter permease [Xanthobacteraceae bacterium]